MAQPMYTQAANIPTYADTAGNVTVDMSGPLGTGVVFVMTASQLLPISVIKVYNSGTTITNGNLTGLN